MVDVMSDGVEPILNPSYDIHGLLLSNEPRNAGGGDATILEQAEILTQRFADRLPRYEVLNSYYRGVPQMPALPSHLTSKFYDFMLMSRSNWCALIVDVVDERLRIDGIRSTKEVVLDDTLWGWWEANNMGLIASEVHTEALKLGVAYASVWPNQPGLPPKMMGESPMSTYVDIDDVTHEPLAAIRIWRNHNDGYLFADFTTPEYQFKLVSTRPFTEEVVRGWRHYKVSGYDVAQVAWSFRTDVESAIVNKIGVVPYVVMSGRPDLLGNHHSEIEGLLPIQDRINKTTFDRLVTQEMTAFPQRWVTGIDIPSDPTTGEPREPFDAAVDRVWTLSAPDGRFGQFPQSSPEGYLAANTADIQAMATQSRTPPHYLIAGMGQFPSGESVRATEYGLTRKINARQLAFGDPWGDFLRLAAKTFGDDVLANDSKVAVRWAQVEAHSEAEVADAILKLSGIPGVPIEPLLSRAGLDPTTFEYYRNRGQIVSPAISVTQAAQPVPQVEPDVSADAAA